MDVPDLIEMEYISCPLCGADDTRFLFERKDHRFLISDQSFCVVQCRRCSLVYVNPRPTEDEIHRFYSDEFYEVTCSPEQTLSKKEKELKAKYDKVKRFTPGRLLDIGCYKGEFMYYMNSRGWSVSGVEFSNKPPNLFNLDIYCGKLRDAPFTAKSFDLVTLWAVFEHVYDPQAMLDQISRFIKPHGNLIMLVTNFNSIPGRFLRHDDVPRHVMMFTKNTVSKMLAKNGFSPISFNCGQDIFGGSTRGLFNYIVKLLAGERIDDVVTQNRRPDRWHQFSSEIKGLDSRVMRFVDPLDIAVTPYIDRLLDSLLLGFIMTVQAVKNNS